MQQVQEEKAREDARLFDEKQEAMTDNVLEVKKSIDLIFALLKLGAPPETLQENRNLIVIGVSTCICPVHARVCSWFFLSLQLLQ